MKQEDGEVDKRLLQLIKNQDEKALEQFYERYSKLIYSLALRIVGIVSDAEEITQEIFLKVWKNAGSYNPSKGRPFSWLMVMTRRHSIDRIRSKSFKAKKTETSLESTDSYTEEANTSTVVAETVIMVEETEIIKEALNKVPKQKRMLIELAYFDGLTHSQIAARLEMPLGTVKTKLRHGIIELRKIVGSKAK